MAETPSLHTIHILAHTHWDREWYHPLPQFVQALVALVADLLDGGASAERPFLLDGQAVVLEDVLAVHPEWAPRLATALQTGALEAGPWYVLADALIPSGEALVRNLLVGRRVLARFGAAPPPVCYAPDSFGHPAALPALARGFGLPVAVLWRGYGGPRWPAGDAARWVAPDGSEVLLWHLPPDGYEFGSALPTAPDAARRRWLRVREVLGERASTGRTLLTVGADHHARPPHLDVALDRLADAAGEHGVRLVRSGLGAWAAAFTESASLHALPVVRGELRDSYGYTWTLQGTLATRAWQKRAVARADRALRWDVEPWLALERLARGREVAAGAESRAVDAGRAADAHTAMPFSRRDRSDALLHHAWCTLLQTMPHDTLCGCSVDAVAHALDERVRETIAASRGLRTEALDARLGRDAVAAREVPRTEWHPLLVVRNRSLRPRSGLVEVELCHTVADVAVGPGSGAAPVPADASTPLVPAGMWLQTFATRRRYERRESPQHYPDNDLVAVTRGLLWWPASRALDGLSLATMPLGAADSSRIAPSPEVPASVRVRRRGHSVQLDNARLRCTVSPRGLVLRDHESGHTLHDLLRVTWQADHGDTYTPAPRGPLRELPLVRARLIARGPLRAAVRLTFAATVPARSAPDERRGERVSSDAAAPVRGRGRVRLRVQVTCTLDAGASHLGLAVETRGAASDHRLRLEMASGVSAPSITADAAMWPVSREPTTASSAAEAVVPSAPLHRWVAAHSSHGGVVLVSDGLAEYEALDSGRLAVTLQRATGELSRATLAERPGHAGWPARTPGAQGPRRSRARFAVAPIGTFSAGWANTLAEDVLLPLVGYTWRDAPAAAPATVSGLTLEAATEVVALAVKPADDGCGLIARCVNWSDAPQGAVWRAPWPDVRATHVRLDETPEPDAERVPLQVSSSASETRCACLVPPRAIVTLRLTRDGDPTARPR